MGFSGSPLISAGIGLILIVSVCYATGRIHQWYKTGDDRELAYRDGYDTATKSLFSLATRTMKVTASQPARGAAQVTPITSASSAAARHRAEDLSKTKITPATRVFRPQEWETRQSA